MFEGKPIIGLAGGIGSGKSFVADLFARLGCFVVRSDEMVHQAYLDQHVKQTLRQWWGDTIFKPDGSIDRPVIARRIFDNPSERVRLEEFIHPVVNQRREEVMKQAALDSSVKAYIWDTPLLFESGLNKQCDTIVFVDAPLAVRLQRVIGRGWNQVELARREQSQMSLDIKRQQADYSISNYSNSDDLPGQVQAIFRQILENPKAPGKPAELTPPTK